MGHNRYSYPRRGDPRYQRVYKSGEHEEDNSEFLYYFQRVTSVDDVHQGLAKMKIKHGDATHVATAYRLENPVGPYNQEYLDDDRISVLFRKSCISR